VIDSTDDTCVTLFPKSYKVFNGTTTTTTTTTIWSGLEDEAHFFLSFFLGFRRPDQSLD